jgi:hypothetical protein
MKLQIQINRHGMCLVLGLAASQAEFGWEAIHSDHIGKKEVLFPTIRYARRNGRNGGKWPERGGKTTSP